MNQLRPDETNGMQSSAEGRGATERQPAPAPPRGPFPSSLNRLDKGTDSERPKTDKPSGSSEWVSRVRLFAKAGIVQVGWSRVVAGRRASVGKERASNHEENQERALRRAKAMVKVSCLTLGVDRLLTLTTRENVTSVAVMDERLKRFVRAMREHFPGYKLVGVMEKHKKNRDGYHVHIGLPGFHDVNVVRACWRWAVSGDEKSADANIDIAYKPDGKGNQYGKAASYMCKYLGKDLSLDHLFGAKRYRVSKGLEVPMQRVVLQVRNQFDAVIAVLGLVRERIPLASLPYIWNRYDYGWVMAVDDGSICEMNGVRREPEAYP